MKIKILGVQKDAVITYEGTTYHGRRICYQYIPTYPIEGVFAGVSFLNDTKFGGLPINVGDHFFADTQRNSNGSLKFTDLTNIKDLIKDFKNE